MRKSNNRREHNPRERESRTSSTSSGLMGDSEGDAAGKLFVGGVSWQTTEVGLREHFGKYGELTDAALMRNKHTGQPRGFGFVKFKDSSSADRVMAEVHILDGRTVDVKKAVPRDKSAPLLERGDSDKGGSVDGDRDSSSRAESSVSTSSSYPSKSNSRVGNGSLSTAPRTAVTKTAWKTASSTPASVTSAVGIKGGGVVAKLPSVAKAPHSSDRQAEQPAPMTRSTSRPEQLRKIFVGGLAPSVTDTDFRLYFEQFGSISDAVVMFDRQTQRSRGFGFITFENSESLEAVLDEEKHEIKCKVVEVKRAEPKEPVRASEDSENGSLGADSVGIESSYIEEYQSIPYGAISLQETCPIPGTGTMGKVFGVRYHYMDDGRGYGIYVPGVPMNTSGAVVAMPMGCTIGMNPSPFAFAPMPPAYYGSITEGGVMPSFDYERAWYSGDFSMDEDFNATGYGSFRGQAATHGRLARKFRPY